MIQISEIIKEINLTFPCIQAKMMKDRVEWSWVEIWRLRNGIFLSRKCIFYYWLMVLSNCWIIQVSRLQNIRNLNFDTPTSSKISQRKHEPKTNRSISKLDLAKNWAPENCYHWLTIMAFSKFFSDIIRLEEFDISRFLSNARKDIFCSVFDSFFPATEGETTSR